MRALLNCVPNVVTGTVVMDVDGAGWWAGQAQPYLASLPTNLTLMAGHTARLTCRVHSLGQKQVNSLTHSLIKLTHTFVSLSFFYLFEVQIKIESNPTSKLIMKSESQKPRKNKTKQIRRE